MANKLGYQCPPSPCSANLDVSSESPTIFGYEQPTLNTDPQLNVWQYGDIPTDLYTTPQNPASTFYSNQPNIPIYKNTLQEQIEDMPASTFGTTYPSSTYYQCQWNGSNLNKGVQNMNNAGLPNIETNTYSSIPCSYRPNFTETARYICTQNPNNLSSSQFNQVCNNVSSN
jgi:hypothetical protein